MTRAPDRIEAMDTRAIYTLDRERAYLFVTLVLLGLAGIVTWLATLLTPEDMVRDLGSISRGRLLQAALLVGGWVPVLAWLWWIRRYVRRITWLASIGVVQIERCGYVGVTSWLVSPAEIEGATTRDGGNTLVDGSAPYHRLRIRGRPILILDDQGTIHDAGALAAIQSGRDPP